MMSESGNHWPNVCDVSLQFNPCSPDIDEALGFSDQENSRDWDFDVLDVEETIEDQEGKLLTSLVRKTYIRHLKMCLVSNYESWWQFSGGGIEISDRVLARCARTLELKAIKQCLLASLYQRAVVSLIKNIKRSTEMNKLYDDLLTTLNHIPRTRSISTQTEKTNKKISDTGSKSFQSSSVMEPHLTKQSPVKKLPESTSSITSSNLANKVLPPEDTPCIKQSSFRTHNSVPSVTTSSPIPINQSVTQSSINLKLLNSNSPKPVPPVSPSQYTKSILTSLVPDSLQTDIPLSQTTKPITITEHSIKKPVKMELIDFSASSLMNTPPNLPPLPKIFSQLDLFPNADFNDALFSSGQSSSHKLNPLSTLVPPVTGSDSLNSKMTPQQIPFCEEMSAMAKDTENSLLSSSTLSSNSVSLRATSKERKRKLNISSAVEKKISLKKRKSVIDAGGRKKNNLDERIKKFQTLFGDSNSVDGEVAASTKKNNYDNVIDTRVKYTKFFLLVNWESERVAQCCQLNKILGLLSIARKEYIVRRFLDLFGPDVSPVDEGLTAANAGCQVMTPEDFSHCRKRTASLVVSELTPFYEQRRQISNREVFKAIAKEITSLILSETFAPDIFLVKAYVDRTFHGGLVYSNVEDVMKIADKQAENSFL